jgi:hypothetical protein
LQSPISFNLHNQCKDINLISPVCFIHGGKWHAVPDQKIGVNDVMRNRVEFDSGQNTLEGALIYKIQKRHNSKFDKYSQDESEDTQLLVAWRVRRGAEPIICVLLVEHDSELDEDKLRRLYQKCWNSLEKQVDFIGSNWLLDDTTSLETTVKVINGGCTLSIFISEEMGDDIERPFWINTSK